MRDGTRVLERMNERREKERRKANGKIFILNIFKVRIGERIREGERLYSRSRDNERKV